MKEYEIVGWGGLQHYSKRKPPWIKFYRSLLTSYRFAQLPDISKAHYCCLLLVASDTDGRFMGDVDYLTRLMHATEPIHLSTLVSAGLIIEIQDASKMLAIDASIRREETEKRREESVPNGTAQDEERWNDFLAPSCRTVGGDEHLSDWLGHWAKCGVRNSTAKRDRAAETMWGLRWLADKGALEDTYGVRKGDTMKPAILRSPRADILARNATEAYQRHAPNQGTEVLRKLEAI